MEDTLSEELLTGTVRLGQEIVLTVKDDKVVPVGKEPASPASNTAEIPAETEAEAAAMAEAEIQAEAPVVSDETEKTPGKEDETIG